jgi:hypothetical protein
MSRAEQQTANREVKYRWDDDGSFFSMLDFRRRWVPWC